MHSLRHSQKCVCLNLYVAHSFYNRNCIGERISLTLTTDTRQIRRKRICIECISDNRLNPHHTQNVHRHRGCMSAILTGQCKGKNTEKAKRFGDGVCVCV